jgi:hypothetical protein
VSEIFTGVGTHLLASALGAGASHLYYRAKGMRDVSGQRALLAGFDARTLFVFPERHQPGSDAILPRTATEDFLAINNLISAFHRCGMYPPDKVRNPHLLTGPERSSRGLILVCSPVRNDTTRDYFAKLREQVPDDCFPHFEEYDEAGSQRRRIRWRAGKWESPSWKQQDPKFDDVAILMKTWNPWKPDHRILVLAGARGLGTWGAGEFVKKWWDRIPSHLGGKLHAEDNFAAILQVVYENRDIKDVFVEKCDLMPQPPEKKP